MLKGSLKAPLSSTSSQQAEKVKKVRFGVSLEKPQSRLGVSLSRNPRARFGVNLFKNPSTVQSGLGVSPLRKPQEMLKIKFKGFGGVSPKNHLWNKNLTENDMQGLSENNDEKATTTEYSCSATDGVLEEDVFEKNVAVQNSRFVVSLAGKPQAQG